MAAKNFSSGETRRNDVKISAAKHGDSTDAIAITSSFAKAGLQLGGLNAVKYRFL